MAKKLFWTRRFDPFLFVELAGICISFSFFLLELYLLNCSVLIRLKNFNFVSPVEKDD